jgi:hypothetical protein
MELEVRHHLPVHLELPQFQDLQVQRLGHSALRELLELQLVGQVLLAQPVQRGQEVVQALEEQPASLG